MSSQQQYCDYIVQFGSALSSEVAFLKSNNGKKIRVIDGTRVDISANRNIYTFETDNELHLPDDTPITLWYKDEQIPGFILSCDGFMITLILNKRIGDYIATAELSAEPWKLYNALRTRLDETVSNSNKIAVDLLCNSKSLFEKQSAIIKGQENALNHSQLNPILVIWGPPGTGKTHTLAKIAIEHMKMGRRVLMVSHSNVSVDGAILKIDELLGKGNKEGTIIRYGYPRDNNLIDNEYLTAFNLSLQRNPDLLAQHKTLLAEKKRLMKANIKGAPYIELENKIKAIKLTMKENEITIVKTARIVATTISKASIDSTIFNGDFDVVMFDEASMAYIPQVVFAASIAKSFFCCLGDYNQLPPIAQSSSEDSKKWLYRDIFQHLGIPDLVEQRKGHPWMVLLDTQRRMHPRIANFIDMRMYHNQLKNLEGIEEQRQSIVDLAPFKSHVTALADLSGMLSICSQSMDKSRYNILSALISLKLALLPQEDASVGIITPYNAQSRLIRAMIRDLSEKGSIDLVVSTVHQFQGSEKDIILFDAVDCYRQKAPGVLLTSTENNIANRLMNVAMTRSKGKFVFITNNSYLENKINSSALMLPKLLEYCSRDHRSDGDVLLKHLSQQNSDRFKFWRSDIEASTDFLQDIMSAHSEIIINIPSPLNEKNTSLLPEALASALSEVQRKNRKVIIRTDNIKSLPEVLKPFATEDAFVWNPITMLDNRIIWYGVPASNACFILSDNTIKTRHRPAIRFEGTITAKLLKSMLGIDNMSFERSGQIEAKISSSFSFADFVSKNKKCPVCGASMKLNKSRSGKFFFGCSSYPACNKTDLIDPDFINQYLDKFNIKCGTDGTRLSAHISTYGIYVSCACADKHFYKLNEI